MAKARIRKASVQATTTFCYEIHSGSCRNLVSASNNYICSAGHGGRLETTSQIDPYIAQMIKSPLLQDRLDVASSLDAPGLAIGSLVNDLSNKVRVAALLNPRCPKEALLSRVKDQEVAIRAAVAKSPHCSEEICENYLQDDEAVKLAALSNPNLNINHLYHYGQNGDLAEKVAIASNESCPNDLQRTLAKSSSAEIHQALASNPSTSADVLVDILAQNDQAITIRVVDGKSTETLAKLFHVSSSEMYKPILERLIEIKKTTLLSSDQGTHRALMAACFEKLPSQSIKQQAFEELSQLYQNDPEMLSHLFNSLS